MDSCKKVTIITLKQSFLFELKSGIEVNPIVLNLHNYLCKFLNNFLINNKLIEEKNKPEAEIASSESFNYIWQPTISHGFA